MPCNTIVRSKVEFLATSTDLDLLKAGLEALGHSVAKYENTLTFSKYGRRGSFNKVTGELVLDRAWDGEKIKRAYSEQVVNSTARKNGWQVEWKTNAAGNREAKVLRRGM